MTTPAVTAAAGPGWGWEMGEQWEYLVATLLTLLLGLVLGMLIVAGAVALAA